MNNPVIDQYRQGRQRIIEGMAIVMPLTNGVPTLAARNVWFRAEAFLEALDQFHRDLEIMDAAGWRKDE